MIKSLWRFLYIDLYDVLSNKYTSTKIYCITQVAVVMATRHLRYQDRGFESHSEHEPVLLCISLILCRQRPSESPVPRPIRSARCVNDP
jgi:hypothetical protein